ncbi:restriction endonuclease subunit S [Bacillus cereus]|uniref:Type I restriction modification DNA specificity domain-containing protein n=1 Tax=Bacillus cereus TaxID=1396 RepID=A0A2C1DGP1_BACCE|nr:restriction endonuclease subunit S [Bacillus cereus]PGS99420.1 hypothetical protein COD09_17950 [Bacillus cereus]
MRYSIPEGWELREFSSFMTESTVKNKTKKDYPPLSITQGQGVILQSDKYNKRIASEDTSTYKIAPKGTVVMNPNYLNYGAIGIQDKVDNGLVSSIYGVFQMDYTVNHRYMRHLLRSKKMIAEYNRYANGGCAVVHTGELHGMHVRLTVPIKDFLAIKWVLPPLQEQQKIAVILSSVDEVIEKTEAIIEKIEEVKKGLMQQLFTKGIEHTKFKKTEIGEIPEEWESVKITDIAENEKNAVKPGPFGSSLKKESYVKFGYKVYGQEQVIANDFTIGDYYIDNKKYEELNSFKVKPFDLLISLVGTFGKIAVMPERNFKPGIINPRLLKVTFDKSKANVYFYKYYMSSSFFYRQLEGMSQGGTMGVINGKILKSIYFPFPPLEEQNRIVNMLTKIDNKIGVEKRKYEKLQSLKKGLMQSLLTGKSRVKVDGIKVTK